MNNNEDASFLQGAEGRLDSLVEEDTINKDEATDQSKVISEIEKSFNAIFGDNNKEVKAEQSDIQSIDRTPVELVPPGAVPYSPLNDIKSIIQSLEWELSNATLDQLDAEISKLYALNEGNSLVLGFLQILRFLGRYIRVKGSDFNRAALVLLLSVYDNMEDVILSEDMTAEQKHATLLEDINKYQEWIVQIGGVNELFDVKSEKDVLDLFLSSITGDKIPPPTTIYAPDETLMPGQLQDERTLKTKIADDDEASTVKGDRTTSTIDNASRNQSYGDDSNDQTRRFEPEEVTSHKITWIALLIVFLILAITASGFLWFYPERRNQALRWMVTNIPYTDRVLTVQKEQKDPDTGKIKFIDVRQRFFRNTALGRDLRVVEGIVINNTAANISKVKLTGELYDEERSLLLLSKASIAGNVLTDDNLEKLDEDKIFSALSIAPASNLSEAMIPPQGQVPFMIVFTREPPKVFKLVIIPVWE